MANYIGTSGNDLLTPPQATSASNFFYGLGGADTLVGSNGNDTFYYGSPSDLVAGESINGGGGVNFIVAGSTAINTNETYDFRLATILRIQGFSFDDASGAQSGSRTAIFNAEQIYGTTTGGVSTRLAVGGSDGRDTLVVNLNTKTSVDLSGFTFSNWDTAFDVVVIQGNANSETIRGSAVKDEILAGGGNDTILLSAGDDVYNGGDGVDTVNLNGGTTGFGLSLDNAGNGTTTIGGIGTLTLISIENVTGGFYAEQINGNSSANVLNGMQGDDILQGRGGNDVLFGGEGNDNLQGGDGVDKIYGGLGDDVLFGDNGNDVLDGGFGNDTLNGGAGNDIFRMTQNGNDDTIVGFQDGYDRIDMRTSVTTSFAGLTITDNGVDTTITYASANHIVIKGVLASSITAADFIF